MRYSLGKTAVVIGIFVFLCLSCASFAEMNGAEQRAAGVLFQLVNQERAAHGLSSLRLDESLTRAAVQHAELMIQAGQMSHQFAGEQDLITRVRQAGAHCSTVAENLAEGPTPEQIQSEWMHSPPHRANLLDPRLNAIGIAVIARGGELYAVEDFAHEIASLTRQQQEQTVGVLLSARGLRLQPGDSTPRQYCQGTATTQRPLPRLIMKYVTSDLQRLPQQVEQGIAGGKFHSASVAACSDVNQGGFDAYRIVILLY